MGLNEIIKAVNDVVWGPVMLVLLVGTGVFLTLRLGVLPWRHLGHALKSVFSREKKAAGGEGDISAFQSLMT
ncbi:sodium:alanine symporter family protein, partial [Bittarella massiliensis]|nr:sodium:alanine symporter family protein [Bittarella massiliensis (ex Durand et al. 2017)]